MLKIMWVEAGKFLWKFGEETPVSADEMMPVGLRAQFSDWDSEFQSVYRGWLADDPRSGSTLHDIRSALHSNGLRLRSMLAEETRQAVYYWFDVDRSEHEDFRWERCPLCDRPLTLGSQNPNDALVCDNDMLVFPG